MGKMVLSQLEQWFMEILMGRGVEKTKPIKANSPGFARKSEALSSPLGVLRTKSEIRRMSAGWHSLKHI